MEFTRKKKIGVHFKDFKENQKALYPEFPQKRKECLFRFCYW